MPGSTHAHPGSILYIPHGGGPLPLLGDGHHQALLTFLQRIPDALVKPAAILIVSAHWECEVATLTSGIDPSLIYDYAGFPDQAYKIQYSAPGAPELANTIHHLLAAQGINSKLDSQRGFDHGLFVPLKIMYPEARIPCLQLSLLKSMDPRSHINMGRALQTLKAQNVLIVGSGFSFHNLPEFLATGNERNDPKNDAFHDWLTPACVSSRLSKKEKMQKLIGWHRAPHARYCHPREEHLLPLHVCLGAATTPGRCVFDDTVLGKRSTAYLW